MWVRSSSYSETIGFNGDNVQLGAAYLDGWILFGPELGWHQDGWYVETTDLEEQMDIDGLFDFLQGEAEYDLSFAGVHFFRDTSGDYWLMFIPLWMTTLITLPAPILWLMFFRKKSRRYRLARGLCAGCGYDMRASEGACPECGFELNGDQ